jgi:hypothetical protein
MLNVQVNSIASNQVKDSRVTSGSITSGSVTVHRVDVDIVMVQFYPGVLSFLGQEVVMEGVDTACGGCESAGVDVETLSKVAENSVEYHFMAVG